MSEQDEIDLRQYWQILKKNKKIILIISLLFFIGSLILNFFLLPKVYSASGKIFIDRKKMQLKMEPRFQTYSEDEINYDTYVDLIKNSKLLDTVLKELNLSISQNSLADMISVNNIQNTGKTDILHIIVEANDPVLAKNIVNTLLIKYVDFFQELYTSNPRETKNFIQTQMNKSKQNLEIEEEKLKKFNKENLLDFLKKQIDLRLDEISRLEKELASTRIEREELEYKLNQLKKEVKDKNYYLSSPIIESHPLYQELQRKLINLEIKLAEIKQNLSEKHPDYLETLVTYEKNKEKIHEVINSVIENYDYKYSNLQSKETNLKENLNKNKKALVNLQAEFAELELTQKRLQRNQELASQTYNMLANKIEELKIEDKVQPTLMKVIEYAEKPESPIKPNIIRNTVLISTLGIFLSIFISFIKEFIINQ